MRSEDSMLQMEVSTVSKGNVKDVSAEMEVDNWPPIDDFYSAKKRVLVERHVCPECGELYVQKGNPVRYRKHHNDWMVDLVSLSCSLCDKTCTMSDDLPCHTNSVHLKIKTFKCETCKRLFAYKGNLEPGSHSCTVNAQVHVCGH